MRIALRLTLLLSVLSCLASMSVATRAETCTPEQFRKVVDEAGAVLRRLNAESQPGLQGGFRKLKNKFGWSDDEYMDKANALLSDRQSEAYDAKAGELLVKLDQLNEGPVGSVQDCARLGELEATALELQATVKVKTRYMLARIDGQLGATGAKPLPSTPVPPSVAQPAPTPKAQSGTEVSSVSPPPPATPKVITPPSAPARTAPVGGWKASTVEDTVRVAPSPHPPPVIAMPKIEPRIEGFSVDEIREASKGYFGAISTGLGSVIEHAFSKLGRPTAYVLGNEGGGAFIAGLRYGKGTLFTRGGRSREVYWHGPSIGYDFGAAGSKTLFLVYGLDEDLDIFTGFSGVDGSAYLVGGVGMTLLTDGKIVMAPIRSGVGLRLGANVGYIRFTARQTWNPF